MTQIGFYYDQTRCAGCKTCQVACKDKNRLGVARCCARWRAARWEPTRP